MTEIDVDFESIFSASPAAYVVDMNWRIVAATDAYLAAAMREREALIGMNVFEAFPNNPDDPNANGAEAWRSSLEGVRDSGQTDHMPIQRYDVERPASEGGGFAERYWRPLNAPVFGADGQVRYIIHGVDNVTEEVKSGQLS